MLVDKSKIHIVVLDKDPIFALGLCALVEKRPEIRAEGYGCAELFGQPQAAEFPVVDIALIDPTQFDLPPILLAQKVRDRFGVCRIIGYTSETELNLAGSCLAAGFGAILPRSAGLEPLHAAITAVHGEAMYVHSSFAKLFEKAPPARAAMRVRDLTDREIYVLKSVAFGKSLKEIGQELDLSSKTIETYKSRGSSKLNLHGRRAIVEYAIRNGWVHSEERSA